MARSGIIVAAHTSLCSNHIFIAGNEEQKHKYIPKLATGEFLGAWGLTEPGSGSDAGGARCSAVRRGKKWVLNGTKTFITNGHYADVAVVVAVTDRTAHTHGLSAFVVEKGTKGFRAGKKENKLGLRASDTSELIFEDCEVPAENLLGKEGDGFIDAMRVLDGGRISIAALGLGMAQGAYEAAVNYSKQRKQFGKAISEFQAIGFKLADMATEIDAARLLTHRAAAMKDAGMKTTQESSMAKLYTSEVAVRCANEVRADSRRLWVHQGLSGGEVLSRREAVHHRRRHQRDPAAGDRAADTEGLSSGQTSHIDHQRPHPGTRCTRARRQSARAGTCHLDRRRPHGRIHRTAEGAFSIQRQCHAARPDRLARSRQEHAGRPDRARVSQAGQDHRHCGRRSHQPVQRRRDSRRPHSHAIALRRPGNLHSQHGHAGLARRTRQHHCRRRDCARCQRPRPGDDRDRGCWAG